MFQSAVAVGLAVLAVGGQSAAQGTCWQLPDQCYAMELIVGDLSIVMSGRRVGREVVVLSTDGDDGSQDEFLCFSEVRADGVFCSNYFLCKPRGDDPATIDTDSAAVLEIRWREMAAELPTTAQVRHEGAAATAAFPAGTWHVLPVTFNHWYSIASGAPQCRLEMTKE